MVAAAQRQSRRGKRESSFLTKLQIAEWQHRQRRRQQQSWHEGTHRERRKKNCCQRKMHIFEKGDTRHESKLSKFSQN
jgi:hypothetical protein